MDVAWVRVNVLRVAGCWVSDSDRPSVNLPAHPGHPEVEQVEFGRLDEF